jgi:hypothetical protein
VLSAYEQFLQIQDDIHKFQVFGPMAGWPDIRHEALVLSNVSCSNGMHRETDAHYDAGPNQRSFEASFFKELSLWSLVEDHGCNFAFQFCKGDEITQNPSFSISLNDDDTAITLKSHCYQRSRLVDREVARKSASTWNILLESEMPRF